MEDHGELPYPPVNTTVETPSESDSTDKIEDLPDILDMEMEIPPPPASEESNDLEVEAIEAIEAQVETVEAVEAVEAIEAQVEAVEYVEEAVESVDVETEVENVEAVAVEEAVEAVEKAPAEDEAAHSQTDESPAEKGGSGSAVDSEPPVQQEAPPVQEESLPVQEESPPVQKALKKVESFNSVSGSSTTVSSGASGVEKTTYDTSVLRKAKSRSTDSDQGSISSRISPTRSSDTISSGALPGAKLKNVNATLQVKEDGTVFSFSDQEKQAFAEHINICLAGDKAVKYMLPINPETDDLFVKFSNGLLLCKLVNAAKIDSIDERAMNLDPHMNNYKKAENQNLALNAAKSIGCQVINVGAADLLKGTPSLVLGLLWQVIRIQLLAQISLKNVPELVTLLNDGETMTAFLALNPEIILLRWLNFHLKRANSTRVVKNFTKDLSDSEVYGVVLQQLSPELCDRIGEKDPMERATHAIKNAKDLGVNVFIKPEHVCNGVKSLNTSFVAQIFNTCHGLNLPPIPSQEDLLNNMIGSDDSYDRKHDLSRESIDAEIRAALDVDGGDSAADTREVRVFSMWINSLNVDGLYIQHLFLDIGGDCTTLIHVIDKVLPGSVNWKRVNRTASPYGLNKFKAVENANYAIELGKSMRFSLVNVGGTDIADGNKKLILAYMWQLMRLYTLKVLSDLAQRTGMVTSGSGVTEMQIIKWAQNKVKDSGGDRTMRSFKDMSVKDSVFFLQLVQAIDKEAVNWEVVRMPPVVKEGETESKEKVALTEEHLLSNAKYVISCARKCGALVFITPEDIVEVKSKMLLTFTASLWATELDPDRNNEL